MLEQNAGGTGTRRRRGVTLRLSRFEARSDAKRIRRRVGRLQLRRSSHPVRSYCLVKPKAATNQGALACRPRTADRRLESALRSVCLCLSVHHLLPFLEYSSFVKVIDLREGRGRMPRNKVSLQDRVGNTDKWLYSFKSS